VQTGTTLRPVAFPLTLVGAFLAVALELLEALAIVLAVGVTRRFRDALIGAGAAAALLGALAVAVGPLLLGSVSLEPLRVVIGTLLLLFGLEWLRKSSLRLAGRRSPSSAFREFVEARDDLEEVPLPPAGRPDWAGRAIAFKGVLLEGIEIVLIVAALGARPGGLAPALLGGAIALVGVVALGARLRAPLSRLPETQLKYLVGVVLSCFGVFFLAEGLGVEWPLGDAALLYLAGVFVLFSQLQVALLAKPRAGVVRG
jgi:Ca2+/H+ antiporter, TMEM165/GDT1 family